MSKLGDNVRRGRCDHQRINGLGHSYVFNSGLDVRFFCACTKQISNDFFSAERGEGERPYKLLGGASHHDLYAHATVLQQTHKFRRLVSSDPAGNAKSNLHEKIVIRQRLGSKSGVRPRPLTGYRCLYQLPPVYLVHF